VRSFLDNKDGWILFFLASTLVLGTAVILAYTHHKFDPARFEGENPPTQHKIIGEFEELLGLT